MNSATETKINRQEAAYIKFRISKANNETIIHIPQEREELINGQAQLLNPSAGHWLSLTEAGKGQLKGKRIMSVVMFAGGMGARSQINGGKQFYELEEGVSLFSKALYLARNEEEYIKCIYIITNKKNALKIADSIDSVKVDFENVQIAIAANPETPILDQYGVQSIYRKEDTKLTYPNGTGSFMKSKIFFNEGDDITIEEHLRLTNTQYLYCFGISNQFEPGIDLGLIGLLAAANSENSGLESNMEASERRPKKLSTVFKYMPSEGNQRTDYPRVSLYEKAGQKQWLVMETESLLAINSNQQAVAACPFWMNNFAIDLKVLAKIGYSNHQSQDLMHEFVSRKIKGRETGTISINVCERTISSTMMPQKSRCIGVRARPYDKFAPKIMHDEFKHKKGRDSSIDQSIRRSKSRLRRK